MVSSTGLRGDESHVLFCWSTVKTRHPPHMSSTEPTETQDSSFLDLPSKVLVNYIMENTKHTDPHYVAASIVAARYDDPNVPEDIHRLLQGHST